MAECNKKPVTSACEIKKGKTLVSPKKVKKHGVTLFKARTPSE